MSRFLVVYASTHGQAANVAERIAATLRGAGHSVELSTDLSASGPDVAAYDATVVGASIHRGKHQRELVDWVRHRQLALNSIPSAFFSVCLAVAEETDEAHRAAGAFIDVFEEDSGWTPRYRTTFAGALRYPRYGLATRVAMRTLMHRGGHPTDTAREFEYTDWDAVDAFAHVCATLPRRASAIS